MIHSQNLILFNIKTKNEEIILEDIGTAYFNISDDGNYLVCQKQYGERREIVLINIFSNERKIIHVAKSDYKVKTDFAPDGKYIFLIDQHNDNHLGKIYLYLYDMRTDRKYQIKINYPTWRFVGW